MFRPVRRILSRAPPFHPLPAAMNARFSLLAAAALSILSLAPAHAESIAPGATYSQNFDAIGTSATATLPSGWKVVNSSSVRDVTQSLYESATSSTGREGTGSGTTHGIYNWENAADSSDRAVGFLASGSGTSTGNLYLTLSASGAIPDFTISYDMKCFRNNTRQFQFQLYYSTDAGISWTSAGSSFCTTYATSSSGIVVNPAGVTSVSSQKLNVSLSSGDIIVFCWNYSVPTGNTVSSAQGLGIDNVAIVAGKNAGLEPLDTPTNLTASNNNPVGFSLSWDAVADATGYDVTVMDSSNASVGNVVVNGTTATISGLASSSTYSAQVVALGNGTTTDSSDPASLSNIQTTAPTVLDTPTDLNSSDIGYFGFTLSWTAVSDATSYTVTLSPSAGSVEVSGTTATVTGLAEGETYTASVVAKGNGTTTVDSPAATLGVTTDTAPAVSAPVLTATDVSSSAFTVSWPAQNDASFSFRAWTLVPADVATEYFAGYPDDPPAGWTFNNLSHDARYADEPIAFDKTKTVSMWMSSPKYDADISSVSFQLRANSASSSTLVLSGSPDGETWTDIDSWTGDNLKGSGVTKTTTVTTLGVRYLKWTFEKDSGNVFIGHVSVNGTGVGKQPSYLAGYGPDATAVAGTSVTISNPVAGETNYIEVTATGLSGKTASTTLPVAVPAVATPKPAVISVK